MQTAAISRLEEIVFQEGKLKVNYLTLRQDVDVKFNNEFLGS